MSSKLYRVMLKVTSSVQPDTTFWQDTVLYCGYDREEARQAYHDSRVTDYWGGYGNRARETVARVIEDAGTNDFEDDLNFEEEFEQDTA